LFTSVDQEDRHTGKVVPAG